MIGPLVGEEPSPIPRRMKKTFNNFLTAFFRVRKPVGYLGQIRASALFVFLVGFAVQQKISNTILCISGLMRFTVH